MKENFVNDMITSLGGLRFRHMDLFRVSCVQLLLNACAETLETLRLYPSDSYGEQFLERSERIQVNDSQWTTALCSNISTCRGTGPSIRSRRRENRLMLPTTSHLTSSNPSFPPSHLLGLWMSLLSTGNPTSAICHIVRGAALYLGVFSE